MILLLYFNRTIGPKIIISYPSNLEENLEKDDIIQIKSLLDNINEGFFSHYFTQELKTANWIFNLDSEWARGRSELLMLTIIIPEEEPDYSYYENLLSNFIEKIRNTSDIFKALYLEDESINNKKEIQEKYTILNEEIHRLYKIVSVKILKTEGSLVSLKTLQKNKEIRLSDSVLDKIMKISKGQKNCFMVFRSRGDSIKVDIIPVNAEKIIRLAIIFGEQMTVRVVQKISYIFSEYKDTISLVFTSGICQEIDRCIYEVYIDPNMKKLNSIIEEIYKIEGVLSIEVKLIEIT
ncbi:MAG: hypothetical protein KGD63_08850 [Candidatus Lokiarchaeota archaeon]|nr:hypothetical protein [Candidatus Lokiarchaeota archaeon]